MINKEDIKVQLAIDENKVYITSTNDPFTCTIEVWVGDDFVYRIHNDYIEKGGYNYGWRWHKPNKNFHGNIVKVILKNVLEPKITPEDPYGEELWER